MEGQLDTDGKAVQARETKFLKIVMGVRRMDKRRNEDIREELGVTTERIPRRQEINVFE